MGKTRKKQKVELVFDEQKRKDFLTGFRKRKNERRKKAKEQVEAMIKEERKRIKSELKAGMKNMKKSFQPLQELTEEDKKQEYEDDEVEVKIVELSANDFAAQRNMIGANTGQESEEEEEPEEDEEEEVDENTIPGMDIVEKKKKRRKPTSEDQDDSKKKSKTEHEFKSKKDIDKVMKKKTLRNLKKTSAFKQKEKFEQVANRKKARREKRNTIKSLPKHKQKEKKRFNNDLNRKIKK
uniref:Nucleolar protein 12 n=1 Tax=Megaselia scalaris TaxID=36166 RepID=T1GMX1_MEGSC